MKTRRFSFCLPLLCWRRSPPKSVRCFSWILLCLGLVAGAYFTGKRRLSGKRPDGRIEWWAWPVLWPFFGFAWGTWHVQRRLSREAACHELAPGVWIGWRCFPSEIPADVKMVIDLTPNFPPRLPCGCASGYRCLPTLDALVPDAESFQRLIAEVAACPQAVFVHCAQGHGRSGTFVVALILARQLAPDEKRHFK